MLPGPLTQATVQEVFAESNQPEDEDTVHQRLRIEAETGKIWQEGCGDQAGNPSSTGRIYLVLGDYEDVYPTWDRANDAWINKWRGRERQLGRSPAPPLGSALAPTQKCTPGAVPTSTPSPSPSPTPLPTPEATAEPTPTEPPGPPTPTPTPEQPDG